MKGEGVKARARERESDREIEHKGAIYDNILER